MLRIIVNKHEIDLPTDISIQVKVLNPIFTESGFDEAYSYSFSVDKTPRNKTVFKDKEYFVSILFNNALITEGYGSIKEKFKSYAIDFKNESLDLRQTIEKTSLKSLTFETVDVCDELDSPTDKIQKWSDHMYQITVIDDPGTGSHKFPHIKAWDETSNSDFFQSWYTKNPDWDFDVNAYWNGEFLKNIGWPLAYNDSQPAWWTTVSPCVRIQYIFQQLIAYLDINVGIDELSEIPEFQQMIHYSLLSLDHVENDGTLNYNVHGTSFDLKKFVPNLTGMDLIKMTNELFGIYVNRSNGKVNFRLKKNIIGSVPVDYSKFYSAEYDIDYLEKTNYVFSYPIDLEALTRFNSLVWEYSVFQDSVAVPYNKHLKRTVGNKSTDTEIQFSYIPMQNRINPIDRVYPVAYGGTISEEVSLVMDFFITMNQISNYYDLQAFNEGGSDVFLIGLIRGVYPVYNFTNSVWNDRLITCNSKKLDKVDYDNNVNYSFGTCSIYANDADSHIDVYLSKFYEYLRTANEITKTLYLPLHKILDIISWKEPNHIIKQRNLSFKGCVKEVNFTLYKNRISPCSIKYAVVADEANGDYNNDFNNDFLS